MRTELSEQGSDFHWQTWEPCETTRSPWDATSSLWASGRDALRALWEHGTANRGWKRLWIPAYFCPEVVDSLEAAGVHIARYADGPLDSATDEKSNDVKEIPVKPGDVLLEVNYFGLRCASHTPVNHTAVEIIEDHTHDPWSGWAWGSNADWCIASLRKTLPLPDGGVLWSPQGHSLPSTKDPTPEGLLASIQKLSAMALKSAYLDGRLAEKEPFRQLVRSSEDGLACRPASGMPPWSSELLATLPVEKWRNHRRSNHQHFSSSLQNIPWVTVLQPQDPESTCPFSGILVFDSAARRQYVQQRLIASRVYPAILWQLDDPVAGDTSCRYNELSKRILSVHCDMRYEIDDIKRVARLVRQYGDRFECMNEVQQCQL